MGVRRSSVFRVACEGSCPGPGVRLVQALSLSAGRSREQSGTGRALSRAGGPGKCVRHSVGYLRGYLRDAKY